MRQDDKKAMQRGIAAWMEDVMRRKGLTARQWSLKAGLSHDTVARALRPDSPFVTTTTTIIKLATCVGEAPPSSGTMSRLPDLKTMIAIVQGIIGSAAPGYPLNEELARVLALALIDTLRMIAEDPTLANSPEETQVVARTLTKRLQPPNAP